MQACAVGSEEAGRPEDLPFWRSPASCSTFQCISQQDAGSATRFTRMNSEDGTALMLTAGGVDESRTALLARANTAFRV